MAVKKAACEPVCSGGQALIGRRRRKGARGKGKSRVLKGRQYEETREKGKEIRGRDRNGKNARIRD